MSEDHSEELGRQVSEDERKLWEEVKRRHHHGPYETVQSTEAGRQCGLHEERARQIVRTWANDGLVKAVDNANLCRLTTYGERFEFDP